MVCLRCIQLVKDALQLLQIPFKYIEIGEVELEEGEVPLEKLTHLSKTLRSVGLELIVDKQKVLIEKIKKIIIDLLHDNEEPPLLNFSVYLSEQLHYDYKYLSHLFSRVQGRTIENFIIAHKIERAKELLVYEGLSIKEVAHKLHYSSVAHLSNQFKKVTGLTPTHYKKLRDERFTKIKNQ